jgi:hypothetical protein
MNKLFCDKCGREKKRGELLQIQITIGKVTAHGEIVSGSSCGGKVGGKKDFCEDCLNEIDSRLAPKYNNEIEINYGTQQTIEEKFTDLIREICREEIGGQVND